MQNGDNFAVYVTDTQGNRLFGLNTFEHHKCTDTARSFSQCQTGFIIGFWCDQASPCTIDFTLFADACTPPSSPPPGTPSLAKVYASKADATLYLDGITPESCKTNPTLYQCGKNYNVALSVAEGTNPSLNVDFTTPGKDECPTGWAQLLCKWPPRSTVYMYCNGGIAYPENAALNHAAVDMHAYMYLRHNLSLPHGLTITICRGQAK